MPEVPLALHDVLNLYAGTVEDAGFAISDGAVAAAQAQIERNRESAGSGEPVAVAALRNWTFEGETDRSIVLTNGPETFEALYWAARAAIARIDGPKPALGDPPPPPLPSRMAINRALLRRIASNSRQLVKVAQLLQATQPPGSPLYNGTLDQTTAALLAEKRPALTIDTDLLLTVRKIWDIGLETVLFQTTMQIDGDIVMRVSPDIGEEQRAFFSDLHQKTVETGIRQWGGLFSLAKTLLGDIGRKLFGNS